MTPRDILTWLTTHPQVAITIATTLAGMGGAARHYQRTGRIPLSTLPWRAVRRLYYLARRRFFTVPRPRKRAYHTTDSLEAVRTRLGTESYEPGWPLSYHYYGEDLNARRYYLDEDAEYPHRQIHIRGFKLDTGVELIAHDEPAPRHHPKAHLKEVDIQDATPWLRNQWSTPNLDPRSYTDTPTES